jgi:hypothetical protein
MSTVTFRHELSTTDKNSKNEKRTVKESIIDGPQGLSVMYLKKEGSSFYKLFVKEDKETGKYVGTEKKDEDEDEKEINMSMADFKKMVSANKHLHFVKEYIDNRRE